MRRRRRIKYYLILSGLIMTCLVSCLNSGKELEQEEVAQIQDYLTNNPSLNFDIKASGLYYLEVKTGTGLPVTSHDTAYVFYTAKLLDGTQLDTNVGTDDTLIIPVDEGYLISGLDEGITYMKEGGKALLLVPSKLAFGSTGDYGNIAGYTPLLFDVELVRAKQGPGKK
jgi:FKBP-type peptidyl-prolyl cis-trans isomerase FkpA